MTEHEETHHMCLFVLDALPHPSWVTRPMATVSQGAAPWITTRQRDMGRCTRYTRIFLVFNYTYSFWLQPTMQPQWPSQFLSGGTRGSTFPFFLTRRGGMKLLVTLNSHSLTWRGGLHLLIVLNFPFRTQRGATTSYHSPWWGQPVVFKQGQAYKVRS